MHLERIWEQLLEEGKTTGTPLCCTEGQQESKDLQTKWMLFCLFLFMHLETETKLNFFLSVIGWLHNTSLTRNQWRNAGNCLTNIAHTRRCLLCYLIRLLMGSSLIPPYLRLVLDLLCPLTGQSVWDGIWMHIAFGSQALLTTASEYSFHFYF